MQKGSQKKKDAFDIENGRLTAMGCRYRMVRRGRKLVIKVRDLKPI